MGEDRRMVSRLYRAMLDYPATSPAAVMGFGYALGLLIAIMLGSHATPGSVEEAYSNLLEAAWIAALGVGGGLSGIGIVVNHVRLVAAGGIMLAGGWFMYSVVAWSTDLQMTGGLAAVAAVGVSIEVRASLAAVRMRRRDT